MILGFILLIARIIVGGVFIYSGWSKLTAPVENFIAVLQGYLLPAGIIPVIAHTIPWLELTLGTFLLLGFTTRFSSSVLSLFLFSFLVLLIRSLVLHLPIHECGCFGEGITLTPKQAIMFDGTLFIGALMVRWKALLIPFSLDRLMNRK